MFNHQSQPLANLNTRTLAFGMDVFLIALMRELIAEGVVTLMLLFLYICVVPLMLNGRTVGKVMFGLRIVSINEKPLTIRRLFIRNWLGYMASGFLMGAGFLWAFRHENQQTWHDLVANTVVVKG